MKQAAVPKLSELNTAGRAELLAIWTATLGKPSRFAEQPRVAGQCSGLAAAGAQIWRP
jgi:hypothetical protein